MKSLAMAASAALTMASPADAVPADFAKKAEALLNHSYPADGPGAAVIVVDEGKTVFASGRGLADVEGKKPIDTGTVFRMGSITKQFSAAIILQLAAEGKLSLDDKLSKYLPDYPKPGADATVTQLLNHTVGVQSYTGIPGWMSEKNTAREFTTEQMIAEFSNLPSPSKPGERFDYNNSGYVLVGAIIEKVTGKPWHRAVEERIAKPLGLSTIRYGVLESQTSAMSKGYTTRDAKLAPAQVIHMSVPHAAGALIGSVEDLAKWNAALHAGKVVPKPYYERMIAPTKLASGDSPYGFGLANREVRGHKAVGHGGGIFGFSTDSLYLPDDDLFVAVFANSDEPQTNPEMMAMQLAALAIGSPYPAFQPASIDPSSIEDWVGVYAIDNGERRFVAREGKYYTQRTGGSELEAIPAGNNRFFYRDSLTWFELTKDKSGAPTMSMYQQGALKPEMSSRSGPIPPPVAAVVVPRATLQRYAGTYSSPIGALTVMLPEEGPMMVQLAGQKPIPVEAVSETEFRTVGVDARIAFQVDGHKVSGLTLKQGGRELPAKRD